ncbi:MAG: tetratricopeptide repeat protein [Sulfurifustis sp.]
MKRYRYLSIFIFPLFLACGCVSFPPTAMSADRANTADADLDERTLYEVLVGEMAVQRGQMDIAVEALSRAAGRTRDARLAERASLAALYAKRFEDARRAASLWVELQPESSDAHEALATAFLELDRVSDARRELGRLLAIERDNLDQAFLRVAALLGRAGPRESGLALMHELTAQYPNVPAAHFALAHLAVRAGDLAAAEAAVDEALKRKPEWEDAALFKARILVSQKNNPAAQRYFEDFLKAHPRAKEFRLHYARYLIDQKQWEPAREQFKRLVSESPEDADALFAVGLLALQTNRLDEAETYFKRALTKQPDNDQARVYLGQTFELDKRYGDAVRTYGEVKSSEYYFEAQLRLAMVTARQGNVQRARELLHAVPTENEQQHVQRVLAEEQILRDAKQFREALNLLNSSLSELPGQSDLLYARALVAERLDMLSVVETDLRAILDRDPKNVNALNALGYTLADRTNRYAEAQTLLMQAMEQKPDDPFVLDSVGWLHYRQGNTAEAIKYLKRAMSLRHSDAEIAAHLGEVLWVTGDRKEAESVWSQALREAPDSETLRDVIKKFKH